MKISKPAIVLSVMMLFLMTSCFDITEEFTIKSNGSGEYSMKMDMYKMLEMMTAIGDSTQLQNDKDYKNVLDTTAYFKDKMSQANDLSKSEKQLLSDSYSHLKIDLSQKQCFMNCYFPVENGKQFNEVYQLTPKAIKYLEPETKENSGNNDKLSNQSSDMAETNKYFDIITGKNFFEKRVKLDELKSYLQKDESMVQMKSLLKDIYFNCIIHTPHPVTKCSNSLAKISDDKRTVTLKISYLDFYEHPEISGIRIEF